MPSQKVKAFALNDVEYTDVDTKKKALAKKRSTVYMSKEEFDSLSALKAVRRAKGEDEAVANEGSGIVNEAPAVGAVGDRESSSSDTGTASGEVAPTSSTRRK
jgi:hypothetical protein